MGVVLTILLALAGCGSSDGPSSDGSDGSDTPSPLPSTGDTPLSEDCAATGDEDGDDLADCDDPDCATTCDADGDGSISVDFGGGDCDDADPLVNPLALEICNGIDDDCDNAIDDQDGSLDPGSALPWYADRDGDGFGGGNVLLFACVAPAGAVADDTDCLDNQPSINPGETEVCDGHDDDCDTLVDDDDPSLDPLTATTWYANVDGDDAGDDLSAILACDAPVGYLAVGGDCDDHNPDVQAPVDWYADADGDGVGAGASAGLSCASPGGGYAPGSLGVDCDDIDPAIYPGAAETCGDAVDQDCDGSDCVSCTEVVVGMLPGWGGSWTDGSLAWADLQANWARYGTCPVRMVDVAVGFDLNALVASGATVLWAGDAAGGGVVYSPAEMQAVHDFTALGNGGLVVSYLLEYSGNDDSALFDIVGIDPTQSKDGLVVPANGDVTVLDASHPLATSLPGVFTLASFLDTQEMRVPWASALLPGAEIVAQSGDGFDVVVAYDAGAWRGAYLGTFAEYSIAGDDAEQAIYDAAFWASGY
jgi:hypothetical protein